MGMFLSKYSMLYALGYGDEGYILPETKKILSQYKLFGLIIHDPKTHSEFHNKLSEIFEKLDDITGKDFLFFCLTDPPQRFKEKENRDYYGIWEKEELLSPLNSYKTKDESITAYSLCQALGLDYEDLPLILLTNNFQFDRFRYIRTNSDQIESQLKEIGFFCSQKHNYFNLINDPELLDLIRTIDSCGGNDIINNQEPIAKTLADFLSFIIKNPIQRDRTILKHVNTILSENLQGTRKVIPPNESRTLLGKIWHRKKINKPEQLDFEEFEPDSIDFLKTEKKNLFLLGGISNLLDPIKILYDLDVPPKYKNYESSKSFYIDKNELTGNQSEVHPNIESKSNPAINLNKKTSKNDESFSINNDSIEEESKIILRTFNSVYPNFQNLILNHGLQLDFSPLISSLCKIFEIEINLSFVHWVRARLNIEMPDYYRKIKPGGGNYNMLPSNMLISNPRPIDFNKGGKYKWRAPGLGESELICKTLHLENQFPNDLITDYNKFIHHWSVIRTHRNMAAHTEAMNQNQFLETKKVFSDFNISGYFDQLINIKLHLKSQ